MLIMSYLYTELYASIRETLEKSYEVILFTFQEQKLLLQCESCNKKYVGSTKTKFRQRFNVYKSYFRTYVRKHGENSLDKGKPVPQASFFSHFFENGHNGNFRVGIEIIDHCDPLGPFYQLRPRNKVPNTNIILDSRREP